MSEPAFLPGAFHMAYDPTTRVLSGRWPAAVADQRLRTHCADLIATACASGDCCFWLLDLRGRNWHTPGFGQWFSEVFAAAVHSALHQSVFIAYVLSPEHQASADTPGVQATQRGCAAHGVYPFFFDSETAAREWLAHQQAHDV